MGLIDAIVKLWVTLLNHLGLYTKRQHDTICSSIRILYESQVTTLTEQNKRQYGT